MQWLTILAAKINPEDVGIPVVAADDAALDTILGIVYSIAGVICVIVIIIAGYTYATSTGDPGSTKKARNAIIYAAVGIVVILLAFTITQFVIGRVG